ncbi:MAG: sulfite exporter TauE/SafE family protein [Pseudomonadota bacterium]|nr:MAG: sulfite exporter TauE/SafE family protein [Pseudomonadota bacterium]
MEDILMSPLLLAALFFVVAFAYSSVGLGGGSSYTALMAIFGVSYVAIPTVSLTLNLLVTSIGSVNFIRQGHLRLHLIGPFLVTSLPMAYLGGSLDVSKQVFEWVLLISLCLVAARIYLWDKPGTPHRIGRRWQLLFAALIGAVLGLLAGIVGIGGGVYLVPLIIVLGLGSPKEAAACGAVFVWVNSLTGLIARLGHHSINVAEFVPLILAVATGALLGSHLGAVHLAPRTMERILGIILLVAIALLARKIILTW